ncbi:MAG: hypothetical protein M3P49_12735 [Actinomycetota bacterium]|nr:hypothetical protein [Actinomycetota bacterium]
MAVSNTMVDDLACVVAEARYWERYYFAKLTETAGSIKEPMIEEHENHRRRWSNARACLSGIYEAVDATGLTGPVGARVREMEGEA